MVEVWLADVQGQYLMQVPCNKHNLQYQDAEFFPASQPGRLPFVLLWVDPQYCFETVYEVYDHSCELVASFWDSRKSCDPSWALLPDNQVAIGDHASFRVWDTEQWWEIDEPFQSLGIEEYTESSGQIAVSASGSRLAYCPAVQRGQRLTLFLFDADSLELLGCFRPEAGADALCDSARTSASCGFSWGLHGWMLAYPISGQGELQVMAPQLGGSTYLQTRLQGCRPYWAPALSPDGAYVAIFHPEGARLEVWDIQRRKCMLKQSFCLPQADLTGHSLQQNFDILWTTCGCQLLTRVTAWSRQPPNPLVWEQVLIVVLA